MSEVTEQDVANVVLDLLTRAVVSIFRSQQFENAEMLAASLTGVCGVAMIDLLIEKFDVEPEQAIALVRSSFETRATEMAEAVAKHRSKAK
jgi:hypothetical protein